VKFDPGFTLLEVMISLAIMAGVILTVIGSFNYHLSMVERDRQETMAVLLGRAKMDDPDFRSSEVGKGTFAPERPEIAWAVDIKPTDYPGVKRVILTVSWDSERRKVDLVQYVAK
jgi:general secretion pathway protein I